MSKSRLGDVYNGPRPWIPTAGREVSGTWGRGDADAGVVTTVEESPSFYNVGEQLARIIWRTVLRRDVLHIRIGGEGERV